MDAVMWLNVVLGIVWATMFIYLNNLRRSVWLSKINLHADYMYVASRLCKLDTIWRSIAKIVGIYRKYDLSPEDQENIMALLNEVSDIMEKENGKEFICEGRGNQI